MAQELTETEVKYMSSAFHDGHYQGYDKGFIDGLKAFAWWKDGVQYVGTSGMTLAQAIEQRNTLYGYNNRA